MSFDIQLLIAIAVASVVGIALGWLLAQVFGRRELEQARIKLADVEARRSVLRESYRRRSNQRIFR